jgi:nitrite reductase/ring-hydroxylating ferredoxin subunit
MKRAEGLHVISRRGFCGALAGCVGFALVDCVDGKAIQVGPLDGSGNPHPDAPVESDGSTGDSGTGATCPATGATDVGAPSAFMLGKPVFIDTGKFFVVRDAGGLYALTSHCTHDLVVVNDDGTEFKCPKHQATFTYDGVVTNGPAFFPLVHYAMCTLANGHVGVITAQTVPRAQRLMV